MNTIIDSAMNRARTVMLVFVLILVTGIAAYNAIPKESEPDVQIPIIYVAMHYEGISPEDSERLLLRPLEKKLSAIDGIKELRSKAYEGGGNVILEFYAGFDSDNALIDVREKVDEARPELPDDIDEPTVHEINLSLFPVLNVILSGRVSERQMVRIARELRDKIEALPQVLTANIAGDREEALEVIIDPLLLESYGLTPGDTLQIFSNNNVLVAAGAMDTGDGSFAIKIPGLLEEAKDFLNLPVVTGDNAEVRLIDVATVRRGFKDATGYASANGQRSITLEVSKRTGENIIETVEAVREVVGEEQKYWPGALQVAFAQDRSGTIREMLANLQNNIIFAVFLVMVVIIAFMGLRSAALVALAVPGAFLTGILFLQLMGMTLNIVVLFSLILSIGMLVDAAIVVSEYADRKRGEGWNIHAAYGGAAKRMAWPVISSTVTTLIVFLPLLFWPGTVGEFMKYMPVTLMVTLTGSLMMALIFLPTIGATVGEWLNRRQPSQDTKRREATQADDDEPWDASMTSLHPFTLRYLRLLTLMLSMPGRAVMGLIGVMIVLFILYANFGKGVEFFPDVEPENMSLLVHARGNLSIDERDSVMQQVYGRIAPLSDEIRMFYTRTGRNNQQELAEDVIGQITMELAHWRTRRPASELKEDILQRTEDMPGIIVEIREQEAGPPVGKPVQIEFRSRFPELLPTAIATFRQGMEEIGGFRDLEDSRPIPEIEWQYRINRELASRFGADVLLAGSFMKLVSNGLIADTYRPDDADEELDVVVRFPESERTISQLERLRITTASGERVPLGNFVQREAQPTINTIDRVDQMRVMTIKADVVPDILPDQKVSELTDWLGQQEWDPRVQVSFKGEDEEQREAGQFLMGAFVLALFGMFLIMVTQFNSIYYTIVVMSAVFFSTGGVLLGLLITDQPFGIVMCGVGVISLAGIVVNNNIIFIDTYSKLLAQGVAVKEALIRTGAQRLRPILLTAGTTVLGLLPMVVGMNIDFAARDITFGAPSSQWWQQLSTSIAGGLAFATILTLFFTPALLLLWHVIAEKLGNWRDHLHKRTAAA